ncbi:uncharacterized protein METZ01_LOCUS71953 [marine metagenome]|uniref:Acyl-CoA dehydrogenase n=1 Tax=marine metagenome TaxID=408172 RepID=A0A381TTC8_9ZZZZ|nr:acyl-CoA dehydrogenase [Gammaproteobacteria bacterium]|tara:strand:- start:1395 stop:2525 length:1131 start_codon:yes stop_codon:yes gene_type:complete
MELNEDQIMVREMAAAFAKERVAQEAPKWEKAGRVDADFLREMGALGLLGMTVPEEYGGADTGYVAFALAIVEIAAGDGGLSTLMSVQNSLTNGLILHAGTAEQKKAYLPKTASGTCIGAFCLTEPQVGSDAAALKTRAEKTDSGDYVLSGTKQFVTSGEIAEVAIIFAVTDEAEGKHGITAFLVPADTPGYKVARAEEKLGQKSSDTAQLVFEDMKVPAECVLGEVGEGYRLALSNLEAGRIGIAAQSVGMARAALDFAIQYAKERESFGQPIIQHQAVSFRLADMAAKLKSAELMTLEAARQKDASIPCLEQACMAKLLASEVAEEVCSAAIQTLGGYGYLSEYPVEKIYRDVRVCQIYEGTSDIQRMIIARGL